MFPQYQIYNKATKQTYVIVHVTYVRVLRVGSQVPDSIGHGVT